MRNALLVLLLLTAVYGCLDNGTRIIIENSPLPVVHENSTGQAVYFCPRDNCSARLVELIKGSETADCAFFDLDIPEVIEALKEKESRVVVDNENMDGLAGMDLARFDDSSRYSHNKFCVFDGRIVWTGSFNPTINGDTRNNNNAVVLESRYIAENYMAEFEELWAGEFGRGDEADYPIVYLDGKETRNAFCPEDNCKRIVLKELEKAEHSVYFMIFSFTDMDIARLIVKKHDEGLDVKGVMEKQRLNMRYNTFKYLDGKGIDVIGDKNKGVMHHKVFIIDNETVITGSTNPTKSGFFRNDENILIIKDKDIARQFLDEFGLIIWDDENAASPFQVP